MNKLSANRAGFLISISLSLAVGFTAGRAMKPARQAPTVASAVTGSSSQALQKFVPPERAPLAEAVKPADETEATNEIQTTEAPLQNANNLTSRAQLDGFLQSLQSWSATDPKAALAYACQHLTLARKDVAVTMLLSAWVKTDSQAAWQWISVNDPDNRKCLDAILGEVGKIDANSAWRFASEAAQRNPTESQTAYLSALQGMAYAGKFDEAVRLIDGATMPPLKAQTDLLTLVASEWGHYEPAKAMAWAQTLPQNAREQIVSSVVESWAEVDPKAVADFAANLPAGNARTRALTQATNIWIDQAPAKVNEVAAWVNQFNGDSGYDPVRFKLATTTAATQNVSASLGWANTITDSELRAQALANILESWQRRDQTGAKYFLQNSSELSSEMRADIQNRLGSDAFTGN